ncbi:MAG: HYR domain-containing protein, partial [Maribacter arcticus]|uniref:HYR domain-containing protein n=1 Tax=Maribacter arcticus TaxID=561365 RepID=UPI0030011B01
QTAGLASGDTFPVGTTTQTFLVTDAAGLTATCSFDVTVNDEQAPDITCPANITRTSLNGNPLVISDIGTATAADNCPGAVNIAGVTLIGDLPIPDTFPVGTTQIKWTAIDAAGNVAQCIQNITVNFTASSEKAITAFSLPSQVGPEVIAGTSVNLTVAAGTDLSVPIVPELIEISPNATISPAANIPQIFNVPVQYTVTGQDNSAQIWTVNVMVEPDTEDPVVTCPGAITVANDAGVCGAVVTFNATATDNLPGVSLSYSVPSGSLFAVGITRVVVTATDAAGLTATCSFDVTVNDTEAPFVSCPGNQTELGDINGDFEIPNYTGLVSAFDNCDGPTLVTQNPIPGTIISGTTTVTITSLDAAGNSGSCTFDVIVEPLPTASIGNKVFEDLNKDGILDAEEPGVPGVTVSLQDCSGNTLDITSTDANGEYLFTNLAPGDYVVVFDNIPTGYEFASQDQGGDDTVDSDAGATGDTACIILAPGEDNDTVDAGIKMITPSKLIITPSSISRTLNVGASTMVNYVVDSEDVSPLPTPAAMSIIDNATDNPATWASTTSAANQGTSYEVNLDATGLAPGTYNATLTAGPVSGYTNASIPITLIVEAIPTVLSVTSFTLVNADNEQDIMTITNGMTIDVTTLPTLNLNIRANTTSDVESVQMQLTGTLSKNATENFAPYALYGDSSGNYVAQAFVIGNYSLTANPYSGSSLGGTLGNALSVNFEFTDQDPVCASFDASLSGITNPSTCLGVGSATAVPSGGVSPFTYQWDNGETSATANNLVVGPHSVIVGDANGCTKTLTFTLTGPPLPAVTLTPFASVLNTAPAFTLTGGSPAGGTYSGPGVIANTFNPAIGVGTYTITYSYTDLNGCSNSATRSITVTTETSNSALLVLDATDDSLLFALTNGLQINKADIGNTPLGIIYNSSLNPGGVQFNLTGPINESRFEGPAPYSLFGDIGINIQGKPFSVGNYTLIANPNSGPTQTINFSVIDGPPGNQTPVAVASGIADAVVAFKVNFSSAGSNDFEGPITGYLWNFGDGNTSTAQNPSHTYVTGGPKSVSLTVTDNEGATGSTNIQITAVDPNDVDKVVSVTLVDAVADNDIIDMVNNYVISNGTGINIRANTDPGVVGSVKFVLSGAVSYTRIESVAPYALYGDASGNYIPTDLPIGLYTLTATPYSASGAKGTAGQSLTINFSVGITPLAAKTQLNEMSIAPNPANLAVTISFDEPILVEEILIFDVTGRLIKTIREPLGLDSRTIDFNVIDLPTGTYFIKTMDSKGTSYQEQMLIERY